MTWRPKGWVNPALPDHPEEWRGYEAGADAMHKADIEWLIQKISHDDRGYVFNMNSKEWQEFIDV